MDFFFPQLMGIKEQGILSMWSWVSGFFNLQLII